MIRWTHAILFGLLLLGSLPAGATEYEILPGVTVVGWERLGTHGQQALTTLLSRIPRPWYIGLREIHIDGEGFDPGVTDQINCWADSSLYEICAHEFGHQVDNARPDDTWQRRLIEEAGCEPSHYVRGGFSPCFFRDNPQEFFASLFGEWVIDSSLMVTRALTAWHTGNPHPLNQIVFLMSVMGEIRGAVIAYRARIPEFWFVSPWQCGEITTTSGPGFRVTSMLDEACHVTAVGERQGI